MFSLFLEKRLYPSGDEGTITSPNYPEVYDTKKDYYWRITAPPGKRIQVQIDYLDIEYDRRCAKDFLKVYDGSSLDSPLLYTYCGYTRPVSFRSSGRYLYLYFRSDNADTRKGFQLTWKTFLGVTTTTLTTTTVNPEGSSFFIQYV